jgi:succinoglycan biosynthesis protein ExoV
MKLFYYDSVPNFGDAINHWLWPRLLPDCWDPDDGVRFSGIGTIISAQMPTAKRWIVFTSGAGYGGLPPDFRDASRWTIVSVRGPLTAAVLGLPRTAAISDGALLLATLPEYAPAPDRERDGIVFMPHHSVDRDVDWQGLCKQAGIEYLSPRDESRAVIARLRRARLVLADAMHAAIVADTLRVPWLPMATSPQISTFKWLDWTRSMSLPYESHAVPVPSMASSLRYRLGKLAAEHHAFDARDEKAALAHFHRRGRLLQRPWWPHARRVAKSAQWRINRLVASPAATRFLGAGDRRRSERTVAALAEAKRKAGFMSEDRVFKDRLDALVTRLALIRPG